MEDGRSARLSIFRWFNAFEGLRLVVLVTVAAVIGVARALQLDSVRRLRTALLLRLLCRLSFGGAGFAASFA